jgi:hypothetical protein
MRLILSFLSHCPARSSTLHAGLQSCFPILFEALRRKSPNFGKRGKPHRSIYCGDEGPLWAVPVQAGKVCNHRASPNRHLSSTPRNGYGSANMQCAARATAHREPLVDGKLEDQFMSASGKLRRGMRWLVKVRKGPSLTPQNFCG